MVSLHETAKSLWKKCSKSKKSFTFSSFLYLFYFINVKNQFFGSKKKVSVCVKLKYKINSSQKWYKSYCSLAPSLLSISEIKEIKEREREREIFFLDINKFYKDISWHTKRHKRNETKIILFNFKFKYSANFDFSSKGKYKNNLYGFLLNFHSFFIAYYCQKNLLKSL